ncbi:MAG: 2-C-methyl-D-erythritol 2,4-cyclodiphosphate synthase [Clostridia bacterium]|nr:2-C-methyl-D-erythritol 2,4-cyclodiphosphate synthase [Clostridia bacterium]
MNCALIAAAGSGSRTGLKYNKIFFSFDFVPMIEKTVSAFLKHPLIDGVVVVCAECDEARLKEILPDSVELVRGGATRSESVFNGLKAIEGRFCKVLVHDGARPFISEEVITRVIDNISANRGAVACVKVTDTIKQVNEDGKIIATPDRNTLYAAQTPQGFMLDELIEAYRFAGNKSFTDDAAVFENAGKEVFVVEGGYENKKITTAEDVKMPDVFLSGIGYDVHAFAKDRKLILGGVEVPSEMGLLGHSDADVLVHAIMDAMLGAAGLGDIGKHFPDTDEKYKGISSMLLLEHVFALLKEKGYSVVNVSAVVMAQKPKLMPYIQQMNENIASALGLSVDRVNVAATTTEKLGFVGRQEGICSQATVMLKKTDSI